MADEVVSRAVREQWLCLGREHFTPSGLLIVAACAAIFWLTLDRQATWFSWLLGAPVAIFGCLMLGWLAAFSWLPSVARRKLAHLPHRRIDVEITASKLVFQTATERLAVDWVELKELRELPNFWLFCLRAGPELPVPADLMGEETIAAVRRFMCAPSGRQGCTSGKPLGC